MKNLLVSLALVAVLTPSQAAATQSIDLKPKKPGALQVEMSGQYRLNATVLSDFGIDAEGTTVDQPFVLDQRIRVRFDGVAGSLRLGTEWDLLSGQLAGYRWDVPGTVDERLRHEFAAITPRGFVPRRAAVTWSSRPLVLEAGLVTSQWGLGMVANNGASDRMFGRSDFGDRVVRLRATGKPLLLAKDHPAADKLFMTGAVDWVIADDIARFVDGQLAIQGILSLLYTDPGHCKQGLYFVVRGQKELPDDRTTWAAVVDAYGDQTIALGESGWRLRLAAEGALIIGTTDRSLTYNERDALILTSGGATGLATVSTPGDHLEVGVRGGLASGDSNPDDGFSRDFTFDRDFDAGMVLFKELGGAIEGGTHALLTDPGNTGHPPDGVDGLVTEGSFRRAFFVQPTVQGRPLPWLEARAGVLFARATVDVSQPFYTFRAGGSNRNHLDEAPEGRYLGTEVDWAVKVGGPLPIPAEAPPTLHFVAQGGHAIPGAALSGEGSPAAIHRLLGTLRFGW